MQIRNNASILHEIRVESNSIIQIGSQIPKMYKKQDVKMGVSKFLCKPKF